MSAQVEGVLDVSINKSAESSSIGSIIYCSIYSES